MEGQGRWSTKGTTPGGGVSRAGCATLGCGRPDSPLRLPFGLRVASGKILTLAFVLSNSKNISLLAFLKPKTAENRQLALWHPVNRLIPENV